MTQRLRVLDAEFLYIEDSNVPMNLGGVLVFEGPSPARQEIRHFFADVVARFPRYREHLRLERRTLGRLSWEDDAEFRLDYHVRWTAVPTPHDDSALCALVGRVMATLLDRKRPLWEAWIVEGLSHGRWAIVMKVHHAMLDGVAGSRMLTEILDWERAGPLVGSSTQRVMAEPEPRTAPSGILRAALEKVLRHPVQSATTAWNVGRGLERLRRGLMHGEPVSIHGSIGAHRAFAVAHVPLSDVARVSSASGATINDVVLAVLGGAYRELLVSRGDDVGRGPLTSLVPVSTRSLQRRSTLDNQISAVLCELPTHLADAGERLLWVKRYMAQQKQSHSVDGLNWLMQVGDAVPPVLLAGLTRILAGTLERYQPRSPGTVTTHVRGAAHPLYCLGRKLEHCYPFVPLMPGARVGTAIMSYDEHIDIGVSSDYDSVPEAHVLAQAIEGELALMLAHFTHSVVSPGAPVRCASSSR